MYNMLDFTIIDSLFCRRVRIINKNTLFLIRKSHFCHFWYLLLSFFSWQFAMLFQWQSKLFVPVVSILYNFIYCWGCSHPEYVWHICCWTSINKQSIVFYTYSWRSVLYKQKYSFSDPEIAFLPFLVFTIVRFFSKVYAHYRHKGVHYARMHIVQP
jgi:hypothetical protein